MVELLGHLDNDHEVTLKTRISLKGNIKVIIKQKKDKDIIEIYGPKNSKGNGKITKLVNMITYNN